jgi:hypothetical protein
MSVPEPHDANTAKQPAGGFESRIDVSLATREWKVDL